MRSAFKGKSPGVKTSRTWWGLVGRNNHNAIHSVHRLTLLSACHPVRLKDEYRTEMLASRVEICEERVIRMNTILAEVDPTQSGIVLLHQQKPSQSYITYIDTPSFEMH